MMSKLAKILIALLMFLQLLASVVFLISFCRYTVGSILIHYNSVGMFPLRYVFLVGSLLMIFFYLFFRFFFTSMMSLFAPFDMFFFMGSWLSIFFISFFVLSTSFPLTFNVSAMKHISLNLFSFFYSLKIMSFNKSSISIFISFFLSLIFMNFTSVFSFNFPFSSQVGLMMFFSLSFWLSFIIFTFYNTPKMFLLHFIPEGTPLLLTFILFLIELVSNLIRPLTLMVRLVANILAGHLLMILLSKLVFYFPLVFFLYIGLNLVEIFVSLVQSYIFVTMLVLYYSEV